MSHSRRRQRLEELAESVSRRSLEKAAERPYEGEQENALDVEVSGDLGPVFVQQLL